MKTASRAKITSVINKAIPRCGLLYKCEGGVTKR